MKIPRRVAQTLLNSLKGGVVPRIGLPYITVGRKAEIDALLHDVEVIQEGGASFRFITGRYGSGKSFLLQTIRNYVMAKDFVVVDADLSPERRLQGTRGQGLATYRELIRNMSTKTKPEGGALSLILDRWISSIQKQAMEESSLPLGDPNLTALVDRKISQAVYSLGELVHGFDFAKLLSMYYRAATNGDEETRAKVEKWFRREYITKTEAKNDLGVNLCIGDDDWYDYLKIFACFLKQSGYNGMLILIDELVNIFKIPNSITRQYNYEKLLTMYNDTMQGRANFLGIIFGSTPQCMEDPRRGVYSYEALRSRLAEGHFTASGEHKDLLSPVIRLQPLSYEELLVLTEKLADIHAELYGYSQIIKQPDMIKFLQIEFWRIGADTHITPREVIRDFIEVLDILYQNPQTTVEKLLCSDDFAYAKNEVESEQTAKEFAEFEI